MHTITYVGKIVFEPENKTKKHESQATWKKVAMVSFEEDYRASTGISAYYSWFLNKRFNLTLNPPQRGAHVTFINDSFKDINHGNGTSEEKQAAWDLLKEKWDGKEISVTLNLRPFTNIYHWWFIVDHKHRDELHAIREEIGLGRPYFGLHMTLGLLNENYKTDKKGQFLLDSQDNKIPLFDHQIEHAKYLYNLNELGLIEMNKDYTNNNPIEIKRFMSQRVDLYNSNDELLSSLYNEYELNHVRIQIAQKRLEGYYIKWKNEKIIISNLGKLENWPEGLYDIQFNQLAELFKAQLNTDEI